MDVETMLNKINDEIPLDIAVIDLMNINTLSTGETVVDVTYPMLSDDLNETLCFSKDMGPKDVLIHLEELVKEKYTNHKDDAYIIDKMNEFLSIIKKELQQM